MKIGIGLLAAGAVAVIGGSIFGLAQQEGQAKKADGPKKKVLFFSPSFGFRHSVVNRPWDKGELAYAEKMLKDFAGEAGYDVWVSQDCKDLEGEDAYKQFDAVIFYTTGNPLINRAGLMKYIRDGGAFIGIHTATDTFHSDADYGKSWPEYTHVVGAAFKTHGDQQKVVIKVEDAEHPSVKGIIPADWAILDEIYQFREFSRDNCHVLLSIDTAKISDKSLAALRMEKGKDYPVSWTRTEGKGRVFYTSLGHREDVWTNPVWRKHLLAGMAWAIEKK